jgi:hypothetical protein
MSAIMPSVIDPPAEDKPPNILHTNMTAPTAEPMCGAANVTINSDGI